MRECYSLDDLLRFSHHVNADSGRAIRRSVAEYSQAVIQSEWQALGQREKDPATEKYFTTLMTVVIRDVPANAEEEAIHQRLIDIAREAGEHRDERITKSLTRIPPTLMGFVHALSAALGPACPATTDAWRPRGPQCSSGMGALSVLLHDKEMFMQRTVFIPH